MFSSMHMLYLHRYSFKLCRYILFKPVSKFLCGINTHSNWKWIWNMQIVIHEREREIFSVRHMQSSNFCQWAKGSRQYYHYYHCIICAALARPQVIPYLDLTVDKYFFFNRNILHEHYCIFKYNDYLWISMLTLERAIFKT